MLYTLLKFLAWGLVLAFVGGCVGWALRALKGRGEVALARSTTIDAGELESMRERLTLLDAAIAERDHLRMQLADMRPTEVATPAHGLDVPVVTVDDEPAAVTDERALDTVAAADALGKKITLDDLTVIEGIGPKIAELCHGIGVSTWRELAETPVDELRSMLQAAGSRYQIHDPSSWPEQAMFLADGRWKEFKSFTSELASRR